MRKIVVISGASGGIGLSAAKQLRDLGHTVYGLCRRPFSENGITFLPVDVTDEQSVKAAFLEIEKREGKIDVLLCNAGFGISGAAEFTALSDAKALFDVNFFGVLSCIQAALPLLRKSESPLIVNTSSVAAVISLPFQSFYSCTKAAINSFTLSLSNELKPFKIPVCAVMFGDVATGFTAARKKSVLGEELYGKRMEKSVAVMEKDEQNGMPPEKAAKALVQLVQTKKPTLFKTVGFSYKLIVFLQKLLPARFVNFLVGKIYG